MLVIFVTLLLTGFLWGGVYLLMASGLNLIYGVMKIVNLAHGDFIVVGGLMTLTLFELHVNPLAALPVAAVAMFATGALVQRGLLERLVESGRSGELRTLLATFGLSYVVSNVGLLLWGGQVQSVPFLEGSVDLLGVRLPQNLLVCSAFAFAFAIAVQVWLTHTTSGKAVRATSQSALGAATCGLNIRRIRVISFALGCAMAGAAGSLTITLIPFQSSSGGPLTVQAFTVIALGGLGNYVGAFFAAAILGIAEVSTSFLFGANAAAAVVYVLFIVILVVRPQGLLGRRARV
ncbi:MAG TPA: branched-chain amino acid ABC transporter permease [Candidatus Elarobacter sp.]|nr:branched-chain amino acid ABC transporter permease [Candidatus Elarobacter sp.]